MDAQDQNPHAEEAQQRWGHTDAYRESAKRTKKYTKEDWATIKAEIDEVEAGMAALLTAGQSPDDAQAMDLAEAARMHIERWFYPCSHRMHVGLADMYTADPRFAAHYDDRAPGLAAFVADAIRANARRQEG